jgi:RND superfamily putative drug exporter
MLEKAGVGDGVLTPFEVLVRGGNPASIAKRLATVKGVEGAVAPTGAAWRHGGDSIVAVVPTADGGSNAARETLKRLRATTHRMSSPGAVTVGGTPADNADFISAVYGNVPLILALISLVTFVLLARAFRSPVLALKAVVLNIISVSATWGALVFIWQDGHGAHLIYGLTATGGISAFIPIIVFAFLYGLSMDYEVFIISRIREEYRATGSTDEAVVRGISRTGRLVTSAALILFLAFLALGSAPETQIKILASGFAIGILLDATIVRAFLVPALVSAFGQWNWWMPEIARKLLRLPAEPHTTDEPRIQPAPSV